MKVNPQVQREKTYFKTFCLGAPIAQVTEPVTHSAILPATDARLRPDRAALELWDTKSAAAFKRKLEDDQRQRKKENDRTGKPWQTRFFTPREGHDDFLLYDYSGKYWEDERTRFETAAPLW